jgi:hypothetical protein
MLRLPTIRPPYLGVALLCWGLVIPSARADAPSGPVGLVLFGDDLPREELRAALARDLGRAVTLLATPAEHVPCVTVTWRREQAELAVTYDEPGRGTLARVIRARPTASQTVEDATVLATSLVRNEADELLGKPAPPRTTAQPPPEVAFLLPPSAKPREDVHRDYVPACASFFYPAATNWNHPYATTRFSFNALYGLIGELDNGLQLGTVNVVVGKSGVATGDMAGAEIGLGLNYVQGRASGLQLALLGNAAGMGVEGAQLSLGANVSRSRLDGFQVAPINVTGDAQGMQIGAVNVGKKVTGAMIGIVNVADEVDGIPIGIVSITRSGGVHPIVWGGSASSLGGGFKFATDYTYTIIAAQYAVVGRADYAATGGREAIHLDRREFVGGGFYLGGHVRIKPAFVDFDLGFSALSATEVTWDPNPNGPQPYHQLLLEPRIRVLGGYSFADHLSLFAGGSLAARAHLVNIGVNTLVSVVPELVAGAQF